MLKIGHRGAGQPENTLKSFRRAIKMGVDMIECDARLTKDGKIVIMHDAKVDRTTNGQGYVQNLTLNQIRKLDAGAGEKVPTLEEVLKLVKGKCQLNVEVKGIEPAMKVAELVTRKKVVKNTLVSMAHVSILNEVRRKYPQLRVGMVVWVFQSRFVQNLVNLFGFIASPIIKYLILYFSRQAKVSEISLTKTLATKQVIKFLQRKGLKLYVWTVDRPVQIKRLKKFRIDGIFSNYPEKLK